jgi:hypothetical protein
MRKAALLAAVMLAATFATTTTHAAAKKDPVAAQRSNFDNFMRDGMNPYQATSKPAAKAKKHAMRHKKAKKKA